jgi:ParB-like chromosome segregation protein Spo0J
MVPRAVETRIEQWPIDKLIFYARNPRKNDSAVDRMCGAIREFGFKIPVLARSDGEVVDDHLRLKAAHKWGSWPGGDSSQIPIILCDGWTPQQVKAFRPLVNRSVTWAQCDEELLALELQELKEADFDLDLSGFDPGEIDGLLALPDEDRANEVLRFRRTLSPAQAIFGSAAIIECSVVTPRAPRMSRVCWATSSRS